MNNNLALIDRAVRGAVALELGTGDHDKAALTELGVSPKRTRHVAGLKVNSLAARDQDVDPESARMVDKLLQYITDRDLVERKLARVNVTPVAVLPITAWEQICNRTGLYRFTPKGDTVKFSAVKLLERASERALAQCIASKKKFHKKSALISLVFLALSVTLCIISSGWWGWGIAAGIISLIVSVCQVCDNPAPWVLRDLEIPHIREVVAEAEKAGTIAKELWPDFKEPAEKGMDIRISLPDPPDHVQQLLVDTERARFVLNVAVVPDAISFKEPVADVLLKKRKAEWGEADRLAALKRDPIAYVIQGSAVAIIAQYGDFPIEKAIVEEVINSNKLV